MTNSEARQQALAIRDAFQFQPTSQVSYQSAGKIIALGDSDSLSRCDELPQGLDLTRVDGEAVSVEIEGYLGRYIVRIGHADDQFTTYQGDAVLDLNAEPRLVRELPPPGYFHAPAQDWDAATVAADLENLVGEFDKPKYFDYDASICAHSVNGNEVCRRCIDACPAEAIQSIGEMIEVDPYLCQGGGSCATVCPSGAIRYLYPTLRDSGKRLRDLLQAYLSHGGERPVVLFHVAPEAPDTYLDAYDNLLPVAVEELASVGMDLCLSALAYGALQVILLADSDTPQSARHNLREQLSWVHAVIGELGLGSVNVVLLEDGAAIPEIESERPIEPSPLDMPPGKRNAIYQALDHLVAELKPETDRIELSPPAPFGEVVIDAGQCTLCMACVGACPGRALQDGSNRELPEVVFNEANCLQCGACVVTCPEDAVTLKPRMLFDHDARVRGRALNRDAPFACIACGKPFAPTSVIAKMQDKLKDHHMFGNQRALDRLKMCEDCRVVDIVEDPEAMGGQFDPLKNFRQ